MPTKTDLKPLAEQIPGGVKWGANGEGMIHCPYHDDQNPSCSINAEKNTFNCFACGETGTLRKLLKHCDIAVPKAQEDATYYLYHDREGKVAHRKKRYYIAGEKKFAYQHQNGAGEWVKNRGGDPLLYHLPEVAKAIISGNPVLICEGEKDADALGALGFVATTAPDGAKSAWKPAYNQYLTGATVLLCGDYDQPGQKYLSDISRSLKGVVADIKVIDLGYEIRKEGGKDVSSWLAEGHTKADFERLILAAKAPESLLHLPDSVTSKGSQRDRLLSLFQKAEGMQTIASTEYPPINWTVKDILPPGFCIFSGGSKMGKTFLCQQLASAVALGLPFLDNPEYPCAKGETLFLELQLSSRLLHDRMEQMGILADDRIQVLHEWPRGIEGVEAVQLWKEIHPACILVVIDMFEQVRDRGENKEHDYSANVVEISRWAKLAQDLDITIIGTNHDKKMATMDFVTDVMGSIGTVGSAATIWSLRRSRGKSEAALHCVGWEVVDHELPLVWESPGPWKLQEGTVGERTESQERQEILDALIVEPLKPKDIADALGKTRNSVYQLLYQMKKAGLVAVEGGKYYIAYEENNRDE